MDLRIIYCFILIWIYLSIVKSTTKKPKSKSKNPKTTEPHDAMLVYQSTFTPFNELLPSSQNLPLNYCSFFNNRAPSPQINLKNCTWYKDNACCLQSEIESTFSKVKIG